MLKTIYTKFYIRRKKSNKLFKKFRSTHKFINKIKKIGKKVVSKKTY